MIVSAYTGGLRVVSLVKILRGTQVHLTILEKRTLPASMLAVGHAQLSPTDDFFARSGNVRCTCATLKKPAR